MNAHHTGVVPDPPRRRRDAQRNYDRLLREARAVVAEQGSDASLEEIARRAELGIATLYRHFPNRTELMRALYDEAMLGLTASASEVLTAASAWRGVSLYVERVAEWLIADPGLPAVIEYMAEADAGYRPVAEFDQPLAQLIARAQAEGELRADIELSDVSFLITMLGGLNSSSSSAASGALIWRRQLGIVLDGLRAQNAHTTLPTRTRSRRR